MQIVVRPREVDKIIFGNFLCSVYVDGIRSKFCCWVGDAFSRLGFEQHISTWTHSNSGTEGLDTEVYVIST